MRTKFSASMEPFRERKVNQKKKLLFTPGNTLEITFLSPLLQDTAAEAVATCTASACMCQINNPLPVAFAAFQLLVKTSLPSALARGN